MTKRRKVKRKKAPWKGYSVEECGQQKAKTYPTLKKARAAAKKAPEATIRSKATGVFVNKEEGTPATTPALTKARVCPAPPPPRECPAPTPYRKRNEKSSDKVGGLIGQNTTVLTTAGNCLTHEPAHYRLTSIARLCPSHDGLTFKRNDCYPSGTQERRYGKDRSEQQKVISNAQASCFEPAVVANTDPTPLGGPPIVTSSGIVLGGNSRAMVLQRVWKDPKGPAAKEYRSYLARHAPCWGFDEADVATTEQPVLVRVLDKVKGTQKNAVRRYNEGLTQELGITEAQVATSARIDSAIIAELENMGEDETIAAFLQSQRSAGLVRLLRAKDVITRQQVSKYLGKNGLLNEDGRRFFTRALVGKMVPDADELDLLPPSIRESLARAVPYFLRAAEVAKGDKWDVRTAMPDAVRLYSAVKASKRPLPIYLNQRGLFDVGVRVTTATVLLAQILLERSGPVQLAAGARRFAAAARGTMTVDLFGEQTTPIESLAAAFNLKPIAGPHIQKVSTFQMGAPPKPAKAAAPKKREERAADLGLSKASQEKLKRQRERLERAQQKTTKAAAKKPSGMPPAMRAVVQKELEGEASSIEDAAKSCYLPLVLREDGWRMFYVDLHSNNHTYDRRECKTSKEPLRWVVTGSSRKDGLLRSISWHGTKKEANAALRALRWERGGIDKDAGPDYFNLRLRQANEAKSGDARSTGKKTTVAKPEPEALGVTKELAQAVGLAPKKAPKPKAKEEPDRPPMWPYFTGSIVMAPTIKVPPFLWLDHKNYLSMLFRQKDKKGRWQPWRAYQVHAVGYDESNYWPMAKPKDNWRSVELYPIDKRTWELFGDKSMMEYRRDLPAKTRDFIDKGKPKAPLKLETSKAPKVAPPPPPPPKEKPKEAARLTKPERKGKACELLSVKEYLAGYRLYYVDVIDYPAVRREESSTGPTPHIRICYLSKERIKWVVTALGASDVNAYLWTPNKKTAAKEVTKLRKHAYYSNVKERQVQEDKAAYKAAQRANLKAMDEAKAAATKRSRIPAKLEAEQVITGNKGNKAARIDTHETQTETRFLVELGTWHPKPKEFKTRKRATSYEELGSARASIEKHIGPESTWVQRLRFVPGEGWKVAV